MSERTPLTRGRNVRTLGLGWVWSAIMISVRVIVRFRHIVAVPPYLSTLWRNYGERRWELWNILAKTTGGGNKRKFCFPVHLIAPRTARNNSAYRRTVLNG